MEDVLEVIKGLVGNGASNQMFKQLQEHKTVIKEECVDGTLELDKYDEYKKEENTIKDNIIKKFGEEVEAAKNELANKELYIKQILEERQNEKQDSIAKDEIILKLKEDNEIASKKLVSQDVKISNLLRVKKIAVMEINKKEMQLVASNEKAEKRNLVHSYIIKHHKEEREIIKKDFDEFIKLYRVREEIVMEVKDDQIDQLNQQKEANKDLNDGLKHYIKAKHDKIDELNQQMTNKDKQIKDQNIQLKQKDRSRMFKNDKITELVQQMEKRDKQIEELRIQLQQKEKTMQVEINKLCMILKDLLLLY